MVYIQVIYTKINLLHNQTSIEFNDYFSSIVPNLAKQLINEPCNEYRGNRVNVATFR